LPLELSALVNGAAELSGCSLAGEIHSNENCFQCQHRFSCFSHFSLGIKKARPAPASLASPGGPEHALPPKKFLKGLNYLFSTLGPKSITRSEKKRNGVPSRLNRGIKER
jgi:hypothetical protein